MNETYSDDVNLFEVEVLNHSYDNQCRLCARKWLNNLPEQQKIQYMGKTIQAKCQAQRTENE